MKKFMAIYLGSPAGREKWQALSEAERNQRQQAGFEAWMAWGTKYQAAIVEQGGPLGKTKRISASGVADTTNAMSGWTIVQAESHEAAAKMFENHPHFTVFPGESVEIMECLPIPKP
jgi:hypothetical protein